MFISSQCTEYNTEMIDLGIKTLFDRKKANAYIQNLNISHTKCMVVIYVWDNNGKPLVCGIIKFLI